ncbi:hypothetical protein ACIQLJ_01660 [Microbacterium sp. NPDC091313]
MTVIALRPGTPDDDNREYLPEAIKGSDIVVNESGNNSQPYPTRLEEHTGTLVDGEEDTWYLYVPESYRPDQPVPLVVSLHGGAMTGWGQAVYSSWTMIAEREGFIVVFPNAHSRRFWLIDIPAADIDGATTPRDDGFYLGRPPQRADDNRDLRFISALIDHVSSTHHVDAGRIYIHGMSMGDGMASQYTRYFGDRLAGSSGSAGPTAPELLFDEDGALINRAGALPNWQTRMEIDFVPPHYTVDAREAARTHREYWLALNGVDPTPSISIRGMDNFAFYEGGVSPVVFRDVKNRDHGQTLDDAELVWSYLFSGTRRLSDGRIDIAPSRRERRGDAVSIAIAEGASTAWLNQEVVDLEGTCFLWRKWKYHGLEGGVLSRGDYLYAPVGFIGRALGAQTERGAGTARLTWPDGTVVEVARGSVVALVDGDVTAMLAEAVERDGELYLSFEWVARDVRGLQASTCGGVTYVTDHHAELSANMALLIADLLAGRPSRSASVRKGTAR